MDNRSKSDLNVNVSTRLRVGNKSKDKYDGKIQTLQKQPITEDKLYKFYVNIEGYTREQITIHTDNGQLIVECRKHENSRDIEKCECLHLKYTLPGDLDVKTLRTEFKKSHVLLVTFGKLDKSEKDSESTSSDGDENEISFNIHDFSTDDIRIKSKHNKLIIKGKKFSKHVDKDHKCTTIKKKFKRVYYIGYDFDPKTIQFKIENGKIYIEMPHKITN